LVSLNRSPTWITPEFGTEFAPQGREQVFTEEQKQGWANDPKGFKEYRQHVETTMNQAFDLFHKESQLQKDAMQHFRTQMKQKLGKKGHLIDKLAPNFSVGCRR
jgi:hypothetical protein